ncbi:MAG TPA: hypothetical protein PK890_08105 [Terrimesophilobacter sp.]|nr:hypothetical protein [Terrimesophilobacter sp.]
MGLIYIVVLAAGIGATLRYLLPGRASYGILLLPALSVVVSVIVWGALTWAGINQTEVWMWLVTLAAGLLAALGSALYLPKHRATVDAALFERLSDPRHAA